MLYALAAFAALVIIVRLNGAAESLFYFPSRDAFRTPPECEDVTFVTPDGISLHGWFVRAQDAAPGEKRPAVLHCHGNAGNIESHLGFSSFLARRGIHVFIFDYRGYGRSQPARGLRRADLLHDALAAFDTLAARPDVDASRLGVYGVSLGGGFALGVAEARSRARGVCTVSAFSTWSGVAADHTSVVGRALIPTGLDPARFASSLGSREYLIVHGSADDIVPPRHADLLATAASGAGVRVTRADIADAGHNDIMDFAESRDAVAEFFLRSLGPDPAAGSPEGP